MKYCCYDFEICINRKEIKYLKKYGCFWFYYKREGKKNSYGLYRLGYCPFCGAQLPKNQLEGDVYWDELEKTVGKEFCDIKPEEIPKEFKTDEWWRKRGFGDTKSGEAFVKRRKKCRNTA